MNTYTFMYYGWIPGYNDFDMDYFDVVSFSLEQALELAKTQVPFIKLGPELVAINNDLI